MSVASPSFHEIKAQVRAVRKAMERAGRADEARVIGIHTPGRWTGEAVRTDGDETYWIVQCDSPLAMRLALNENPLDVTTRVLLTNLHEGDLELDVLLRLAKRQLFAIQGWRNVQTLFQAHTVDPRITRHGWMADLLLQSADEFPATANGFLDAETVWGLILERELGLAHERPDLPALLAWTVDENSVARWNSASQQFREAAAEWIGQTTGPVGTVVLNCLESWDRPDAVPIGLAMDVVFHPDAAGRLEKSAGYLEARFLGQPLSRTLIERWSSAALEVVSVRLGSRPRLKHAQLERADEILTEVSADDFAWLSRWSPTGFDHRLARYGRALQESLVVEPLVVPEHLAELKDAVNEHDFARRDHERRRIDRVEMSCRLVRWLATVQEHGMPMHSSLPDAARWHLSEGAFIDWARNALRSSDAVRELAEAYSALWDAVTCRRQEQSQHFAQLLADWTAAGSTGEEVVPVERVLESVVSPLADAAPILLLVLDGMSGAVCREILADLSRSNDWTLIAPRNGGVLRPAMATVPSVTEVSRTSLLSGQLQQGDSSTERRGFAAHPALLQHCRSGQPPVLFHKSDLTEPDTAGAAQAVRDEVASRTRRVVGVVINAVDDHLLKGDQLDIRWGRDEIKVLPTLLHEARQAGRVVILLSDHGHVLDYHSEYRPFEASERWRRDDGNSQNGELQVRGSRVVLADNQRIIVPWDERIRYSKGKRNGYHGGVSPQEMVIPMAVLCPGEEAPDGWVLAPIDTPHWWDESITDAGDEDARIEKPTIKKKPGLLFDPDAEEEAAVATDDVPAEPERPAWLVELLASPVLAEQKALAGRITPDDNQIASFLAAVDRAGGKLTATALARRLKMPPLRLRGFLTVIGRVLNIEGYAVVTRDEASDTVELNRELLIRQFDLEEGGS